MARRHELVSAAAHPLNPGARAEARICQVARLRVGGRALVAANVHATTRDWVAAGEELERVSRLVAGEEPAIVCSDFNIPGEGLSGFSEPLPGIDQVLVRGLELLESPSLWPDARRRIEGGALLSDHARVEAEMMLR